MAKWLDKGVVSCLTTHTVGWGVLGVCTAFAALVVTGRRRGIGQHNMGLGKRAFVVINSFAYGKCHTFISNLSIQLTLLAFVVSCRKGSLEIVSTPDR
jgi:hypothetical protein